MVSKITSLASIPISDYLNPEAIGRALIVVVPSKETFVRLTHNQLVARIGLY